MELIKLSDSLWVPEDFGKNHHYYADEKGEKEYTGITSILGVIAKPALIGWAARMAVEHIREGASIFKNAAGTGGLVDLVGEETSWNLLLEEARTAHTKKKEAAGEHGTDTHALVEEYIKDCIDNGEGEPLYNFQIIMHKIKPFVDWACENVDHFLFSERRMANKDLFIAGTADFAYVDKEGKKVMSDFKTSGSGIYYEMFLQAAAYQLLAEGEGDEPYDYRTVVRLDKKGNFEFAKRYDYETDKNAFLAALTIYRAQATYKTNK